MKKYEVFLFDTFDSMYADEDYCNFVGVHSTGIIICTDTSKASICKKLGLYDPYMLDVYDIGDCVLYVQYAGEPFCELHEIV